MRRKHRRKPSPIQASVVHHNGRPFLKVTKTRRGKPSTSYRKIK